jgi:hypothetical protein
MLYNLVKMLYNLVKMLYNCCKMYNAKECMWTFSCNIRENAIYFSTNEGGGSIMKMKKYFDF